MTLFSNLTLFFKKKKTIPGLDVGALSQLWGQSSLLYTRLDCSCPVIKNAGIHQSIWRWSVVTLCHGVFKVLCRFWVRPQDGADAMFWTAVGGLAERLMSQLREHPLMQMPASFLLSQPNCVLICKESNLRQIHHSLKAVGLRSLYLNLFFSCIMGINSWESCINFSFVLGRLGFIADLFGPLLGTFLPNLLGHHSSMSTVGVIFNRLDS